METVPNQREVSNGPRSVQHGVIKFDSIDDYDEALVIKERLEHIYPDETFEIAGVQEDYKIICREKESTYSDYL